MNEKYIYLIHIYVETRFLKTENTHERAAILMFTHSTHNEFPRWNYLVATVQEKVGLPC